MQLATALGLKNGEMVCFVGAGGKTGLMLRLASRVRLRRPEGTGNHQHQDVCPAASGLR